LVSVALAVNFGVAGLVGLDLVMPIGGELGQPFIGMEQSVNETAEKSAEIH